MKKLLILVLFTITVISAQTRLKTDQIEVKFNVGSPPITVVWAAIDNQAIYFLAPGTNTNITKVAVYRNGLRQNDVNIGIIKADYTLSENKLQITFVGESIPKQDDIILIDYWVDCVCKE